MFRWIFHSESLVFSWILIQPFSLYHIPNWVAKDKEAVLPVTKFLIYTHQHLSMVPVVHFYGDAVQLCLCHLCKECLGSVLAVLDVKLYFEMKIRIMLIIVILCFTLKLFVPLFLWNRVYNKCKTVRVKCFVFSGCKFSCSRLPCYQGQISPNCNLQLDWKNTIQNVTNNYELLFLN